MSRSKRLLAAIGVVIAAGAVPAIAAPTATELSRFQDPRIDEASGIAVSSRNPDVVFVQNDSGDSARFFAVDARSGKTRAVYDVPGARNVDWEDMAVAGGYVWLADIGDNGGDRSSVQIYRVEEPIVPSGATGQTLTTSTPTVWRLRYPDGPHDAESLAVFPGGAAYIITKSLVGDSVVYRVPARPGDAVQTMTKVGDLGFSVTGTRNPFGLVGQLSATGAAVSADGSVLVVRTYSDAYLWPVTDGELLMAISYTAKRVPLPEQPQGEGIALDGSRLLVDSEGVQSAVYTMPIPTLSPAPLPSSSLTTPGEDSPTGGETGTNLVIMLFFAGTATFLVGGVIALIVVFARWRGAVRRRSDVPDDDV